MNMVKNIILILTLIFAILIDREQTLLIKDLQHKSVYYGCAKFTNTNMNEVIFNNEQ